MTGCPHLMTFIERQGPRLFQQAGGKPDLADVVDQPGKVRESLILFA